MAFAALGLVACTTDVTDDQAVTLPDSWGGDLVKHTLDVSLDVDTKLALGDKTAEGKYPVKWTEGDILGVNGIASSGAVVMPDNPSVASFEFYAAADTVQYHVVYPYIEGAVGTQPYYSVVSFAAEQYYTEGSFDPASFPLQGYIAGTKTTADDGTVTLTQPDFTQLTLYPVSTILRFEMTAEEVVTLTKLEMRSATGKLSGLFDTNCKYAYGLAPQSTASDEMTYIFPDGYDEGLLCFGAKGFRPHLYTRQVLHGRPYGRHGCRLRCAEPEGRCCQGVQDRDLQEQPRRVRGYHLRD